MFRTWKWKREKVIAISVAYLVPSKEEFLTKLGQDPEEIEGHVLPIL